MPSLADWHAENALLQIGQLPRVEEPFKEIGRAEMNDGKTRPVEYLFGDKAIPARVARGVAVCRALRQIDDRRHVRFLRSLREFTVAWIRPGLTGQQR